MAQPSGATVIYVVSGTFSFYPATTCQRQNFTAGQGVVEQGGGVQLARNEGTEPLVLFVVYFDVPTATPGAFRIDQPEPSNCTGLAGVPTASPSPTPVPAAAPTTAPTAAARLPSTATVGVEPGPGVPLAAALLVLAAVGGLTYVRLSRRR